MNTFADRLIRWQKKHGRHDLPWQQTKDPYRVWLSEIMLQQTQVGTVIPYYLRFLARFPDLATLAAAPVEDVMALWSGLGYYARARNLHACAQALVREHGGNFPHEPAVIAGLPGIGRSTANAIAAFCFGARVPILDGNVKRLLCRHTGFDGFPNASAVERELWRLAEALLPRQEVGAYIQAQMDLGATVCTRSRPACNDCPLAGDCVARRDGRTTELPVARPRKAIPLREITLLVFMREGLVLLEPRPPTGVWGGLLSLPESADGADAEKTAARLACRIISRRPLEPLMHVFTHFRLRMLPMLCEVAPQPAAALSNARWLGSGDIASAPLPAPIKTLLTALFDQSVV